MKKILILISLFIVICSLSAAVSKNFKTVVELETEQKISERIEDLLLSFVGKSVVVVDLDLNYLTPSPNNYKGDSKSFYKDDIQKIKAEVLKNKHENAKIDQIQIVSMKISIYLKKSIKSDKEEFVRNSVIEWLGLDLQKGDELSIYKTLSNTVAGEKTKKTSIISQPDTRVNQSIPFTNKAEGIPTNILVIVIIGLILSIILLILNFTLRFGIKSLHAAISQSKTSKTGNQTQVKSGSASDSFAILDESKRNPLGINILEDKKDNMKEFSDFNFMINLTNDEFFDLIGSNKFQENELTYLLSVLPVNFVNRLLMNDESKRTDRLVELMMKETHLSKNKLIEFKTDILEKYKKIIDGQVIKIDGKAALVKFINNLPNKRANAIFTHIVESDQKTAIEIRDEIFLYEDIVKLDDPVLKEIIFEMDHELLIEFLKCTDETIKQKFISNMTKRTKSITNEELQFAGEQTVEEKEIVIDKTLKMIKTILGYI